jgi:hypothetical protein
MLFNRAYQHQSVKQVLKPRYNVKAHQHIILMKYIHITSPLRPFLQTPWKDKPYLVLLLSSSSGLHSSTSSAYCFTSIVQRTVALCCDLVPLCTVCECWRTILSFNRNTLINCHYDMGNRFGHAFWLRLEIAGIALRDISWYNAGRAEEHVAYDAIPTLAKCFAAITALQ